MENLTAKISCFARAYHYKTSERPIFGDSAAAALLARDYDAIAAHIAQGIQFFAPGFTGSADEALKIAVDGQLSPSVLGRSAFAEQCLTNEARLGCRQYVLFAAGYDTFAPRALVQGLRVYELDQPGLIEDKKRRIERSDIEEKAAVEYVPCDLADAGWTTLLRGAGFRPGDKSFGSLLGLSYYLDSESFRVLLRSISDLWSDGSAICFDYQTTDGSGETRRNEQLAGAAGESMKAKYTAAGMEKMLADCGFLIYEQLDDEEMTKRYFAPCRGDMRAPKGVNYVLAVKKRV